MSCKLCKAADQRQLCSLVARASPGWPRPVWHPLAVGNFLFCQKAQRKAWVQRTGERAATAGCAASSSSGSTQSQQGVDAVAELLKMRKPQLQQMAREAGLPHSGTKEQLAARLLQDKGALQGSIDDTAEISDADQEEEQHRDSAMHDIVGSHDETTGHALHSVELEDLSDWGQFDAEGSGFERQPAFRLAEDAEAEE